MEILNLFTTWLFAAWQMIGTYVFTGWGFVGAALFCFPLVRKLIKIFKNTF